MQHQGMILCDFCFSAIETEGSCPKCGLTHQNYVHEVGILPPGTRLKGEKDYIIGRLLGRGGFGATYLAYSMERNSVVAIKEYFPTQIATRGKGETCLSVISQDKNQVFLKGAGKMYEEAATVSKFNGCKNIVSIYEFFYDNGTVYFSMEYLEGIDLKNYIQKRGGRISEIELIKVVQGICEALRIVHAEDMVHRDIAPDNMFICTNEDIKLIDFGAAKQVVNDEANREYSKVLKPGFAPIEQYSSKGNQGPWTDIYAVGATMYYALTGKLPPDAPSRQYDMVDLVFPPESGISPAMMRIIGKCMKNSIGERYQNASELLADINSLGFDDIAIGGMKNDIRNGANQAGVSNGDLTGLAPGGEKFDTDIFAGPFSGRNSALLTGSGSHYGLLLDDERKETESRGFFKGLMLGLSLGVVAIASIIVVYLIIASGPAIEADVDSFGNDIQRQVQTTGGYGVIPGQMN